MLPRYFHSKKRWAVLHENGQAPFKATGLDEMGRVASAFLRRVALRKSHF